MSNKTEEVDQFINKLENKVISKDGTTIAYTKIGDGPPLILVDGALCYRASGPAEPLAKQLADTFTVYTYDRRGRGDSTDVPPYSVQKEIEDIEALINETGSEVYLYGISSGAALALEAANAGLKIKKLALYEAPFIVDDSRTPVPESYLNELWELLDKNRRSASVKHFMSKAVGLPKAIVFLMPLMPAWSKLKKVAHTLTYDALIVDNELKGKPFPANRWESVNASTIVIGGEKSQAWVQNSTKALADNLSQAQFTFLKGQTHMVKPEVLAPVLKDFFR
ncbi:MAG: alpha/beta hydrolase [Balneolaceae bacterium]